MISVKKSLGLVAAAMAGICLFAPLVNASVIWDGDASGGTGVFGNLNLDAGATLTVVNDATQGQVFRFYKPSGSNRCEAHGANGFDATTGQTYVIGWRSQLTSTVTNNAIFQWKAYGNNMHQNYPVVLKCIDGKMTLEQYDPNPSGSGGNVKHTLFSRAISANTWYTHVIMIHTSNTRGDTSSGYVEYWFNGEHVTFPNGSTRFSCSTWDADQCDPKWGVYGASTTTITNLVDALKIGTTYADVAPGGIQAVASPAFSPDGGTYPTPQSVSITTATGGATIRYTLDGSTPSTTSGTVYTGPVTISTSATLKAIAYASGMTSSPVVSANYTIGVPTSTVAFEAENVAVTNSGTGNSVQTDANASGGKWVSLDAENTGSWIEFTTPSIPAGTYQLQMSYKTNNNRGILALRVDGTQIGSTLDQYATTSTYPTKSFGAVTFGSNGTHKIRLAVTAKNSASSGYILSADKFTFVGQ
jgi:hypothetical protein